MDNRIKILYIEDDVILDPHVVEDKLTRKIRKPAFVEQVHEMIQENRFRREENTLNGLVIPIICLAQERSLMNT